MDRAAAVGQGAPAGDQPLGVPAAYGRATAGGSQPAAADVCANCAAPLFGPYCAQCGQKAAHRIVSLRSIVEDAVEDQLSLNATLPRTLRVLFLHPGRLTREYVSGRVASYIPPMRLYLMASVLFFLVMAAMPEATDVTVGNGVSAPVQPSGKLPAPVASTAEPVAAVTIRAPGVRIRLDTLGTPAWMHAPVLRLIAQNQRLRKMDPEQAKRALVAKLADDIPKVVFVLLPVFALLLELLYIRRRRLYVEHFVFALHVHALAFLAFTVLLLARSPTLSRLVYLGLAGYLFQALRVVYGQGWARTTLKFAFLCFAYLMLSAIGLAVSTLAALFVV